MKNPLSFSGRADRFEWWWISILVDLGMQLGVIFGLVCLASGEWGPRLAAAALFGFALLCFWASLAVSVRRLRDRGRSPWWFLWVLVPVAGWVVLVVECGCLASPEARAPRRLVRRQVTAAPQARGSEQAAIGHSIERETGEREGFR